MQPKSSDPRIAGMFGGDRFWSIASLLLLWILYAFVFYQVMPNINSPEVFWLLALGGALVLIFNTASILVMVAHLSEDRDEIYGLDLHYLDENKNKQ
jgi:hypothetical protein